jgi:serine/threonine-protein kinase
VCQALIAAHDKAIVHRDIKPENVFLVGEGEDRLVKVLDFGISRIGDASAELTKTGVVIGTPAYMPPEQARGTRVDHRADIYAVGSILYESVTGTRPFAGGDQVATLAAVLTVDPVRPCILNAQLPPALELVIQKAMAKNPEERFRSMRELDAALSEFDDAVRFAPRQSMIPERVSLSTLPHIELPAPLSRLLGRSSFQLDNTRAELLSYSIALGLVTLLGLIDASTGLVRLSRSGTPITGPEIVLSSLGSLGLLVTPAILWGRYVVQHVWPSTPRVLDTISRVRRVLFDALVTYASGTLLVRVLAGALRSDASAATWSGWGVLVFIAATVAGVRAVRRQARAVSAAQGG